MSVLEEIEHHATVRVEKPAPKAGLTLMQANGLMLLTALAWGAGNVSHKLILDHLDPFAANGLTCLIGAAALYPLARREAKADRSSVSGSGLRLLQVAAAFTVASTLMQIGYGHTTVTNAGFLVNTAAVMTPLLVWIFYRQRPKLWIWPAGLFSLLGVFLLGGGRLSSLNFGDLVILASAFAFAVWTLAVERYMLCHRRPAWLATVQLFFCGWVCLFVGALTYGPPTGAAVLAALPEILFLGLISKGLAYWLMAIAQQRVTATCAAVLVSAEAVFGAIAAAVFLAESISRLGVLGALCIVSGVSIAALKPVQSEESVQKSPSTGPKA